MGNLFLIGLAGPPMNLRYTLSARGSTPPAFYGILSEEAHHGHTSQE